MSISAARCIASISRKTARAFRWSACTPRAPTEGNGGICLRTRSSRRISASSRSTCPGTANPIRRQVGTATEYQLTTARYTETIRAFCKALKLDKPVVMGCSIGGRIVLNLAIDHAAEFRALIGLEAADFQAPWYDTAWLNRPDVHGGEVCAALVSGLIAPQSPDSPAPRNVMGLQAGRAGCLQGRSLFLSGRRRSARPGREDRY